MHEKKATEEQKKAMLLADLKAQQDMLMLQKQMEFEKLKQIEQEADQNLVKI